MLIFSSAAPFDLGTVRGSFGDKACLRAGLPEASGALGQLS